MAVTDPAAEAEFLRARAEEQPEAAMVLHQVLGMTGRLPVPQALDLESMAYSALLGGSGFAGWLAARGPRPAPPPATGEPVLVRRTGDVFGAKPQGARVRSPLLDLASDRPMTMR
ncbi:hypothetical protein ABT075_16165 [Streptomyces sp. NPDC002677]|uniref:hypothetical protein n=1 Tax=Streptomyces sp. NPDC002677 TaxID=3154774 RepID=UPI00331BC0A4